MEAPIKILLIVFITWLASDILKTMFDTVKNKKFRLRMLLAYGGMPSSHTTFVTSLAISIYLIEGITTAFLISCAFFIIVVRDLITLRNRIDMNSKNISKLLKKKPRPELLSHNFMEIIVGFVLGIVLPLLLNTLF